MLMFDLIPEQRLKFNLRTYVCTLTECSKGFEALDMNKQSIRYYICHNKENIRLPLKYVFGGFILALIHIV